MSDEAKIELVKAETKKIETKGKTEERIIHAYSKLAISIGVCLIILTAVTLFILRG